VNAVPAPAVIEDDTLPHQVRIRLRANDIYISCTCLRQPDGSYTPIETRNVWTVAEVLAIYRAHEEAVTP
jgi:hypothetical protein